MGAPPGRSLGENRATSHPGPAPDRWPLWLRAEEAATGAVQEVAVRYAANAPFTALLSLRALSAGQWTVTLETRGPEGTRRTSQLPTPAGLPPARWYRRGRPHSAEPLPADDTGTLTLRIAPIALGPAVRRRLADLRRRAFRISASRISPSRKNRTPRDRTPD
ncbi:hypothetical protein E4099_07725 [Streptomyces palmae]|uniref:Uncharacterized protein n=1 Tax=Streptomyces palmae TaxID=1701085 RepID=A0A4Z0HG34_9ACTN|nr:hypothetical protein E4099_07725 [Streptomyces palmae]